MILVLSSDQFSIQMITFLYSLEAAWKNVRVSQRINVVCYREAPNDTFVDSDRRSQVILLLHMRSVTPIALR